MGLMLSTTKKGMITQLMMKDAYIYPWIHRLSLRQNIWKTLKKKQKLKRFCVGVASVGATACSSDTESHKNIKNWREAMKHLPRIDRAGVLRRSGSVLILERWPSGVRWKKSTLASNSGKRPL